MSCMIAETIQAISVLSPLIQKIADYIAGNHDDLPEVPLVLKSEIEFERLQARRRKAGTAHSAK